MAHKVGVVDLGVMGANLALNMERNGFAVVGYDLDLTKAQAFLQGPARGRKITSADSPALFRQLLEKPRRILIMVPAGAPMDSAITHLKPHLVKVPSKDTAVVVAALSRQIRKLPASLRRSLTWDRGLEMAKHKTFTVGTNVKVYFCDPQSPWQRGTNENMNRLLRQYFPKRTDLSCFKQSELDKVALRLNQRPRKTLGFQTPASRLQASVASTH